MQVTSNSHISTAPTTLLSYSYRVASVKLSLPAARPAFTAADGHSRRLDAQRSPGSVGRDDLSSRGLDSGAARNRHRGRAARTARRRSAASRRSVLPARLLLDVVRSLPADEADAGAACRRAGCRAICGWRDLPPAHAARRGLPAAPRALARDAHHAAGRGVCADDRAGRPLGLAGRDAAGADRDPDVGLRAASCGWSRPTPTG